MDAKVVGSRIMVLPDNPKDVSNGGIVLPDSSQPCMNRGTVVVMGRVHPHQEYGLGDTVIYDSYAGNDVELDDTIYKVLDEKDILVVLK